MFNKKMNRTGEFEQVYCNIYYARFIKHVDVKKKKN